MATTAILGFPRIGAQRELKKATESYWKGEIDKDALYKAASAIQTENWKRQKDAGLTTVATGDYTFYDQVLGHSQVFGCIPKRYDSLKNGDPLTLYFAMARGHQKDGVDVVACEMTKWFDTNYHYIVPEFANDTEFTLQANNYLVQAFKDAKAQGFNARPVVIGPITYLALGKFHSGEEKGDRRKLLDRLLPVYEKLLAEFKAAGAEWVQVDEPYLAMDLCESMAEGYKTAYERLNKSGLKILLTTYFDGLRDNTDLAFSLGTAGVHIDLVRAPDQLDACLKAIKPDQLLSIGVVDGRNIWKNDFAKSLTQIEKATKALGTDRVIISSSCSLLHSPVDLKAETKMDAELKQWLAFGQQKIEEIATLARAANGQDAKAELEANKKAIDARKTSKRIHNDAVKKRLDAVDAKMYERKNPFKKRVAAQDAQLKLPPLPTTTIGSFPQTAEVRKARADFKAGTITQAQYDAFLEEETKKCIQYQIDADIDVPVHGEFERNDMVEYFGEQLAGFTFSQNGWVQSYGSRCVKPPIIFGDVSRPQPMTVRWSKFAQTLTDRPVKGMLTGPVTILQWSFVRDDQPRETTCKQIALAIRDEVVDLEKAGIHVIQIDEPAVREGLPLRNADKASYLKWAVDSFRLSAAGVADGTQIHTHMCYCEFGDIMQEIADLDADVISIETSRSAMELLNDFASFKYPNQVGPGVYDIHSPRVPKQEEMVTLLRKALEVLEPNQVWVNPDCGLKTRGWKEVDPALKAMVAAAKQMRSEISTPKAKVANG